MQNGENKIQLYGCEKSIYEILRQNNIIYTIEENDNRTKHFELKHTFQIPSSTTIHFCNEICYDGRNECVELTFDDNFTAIFSNKQQLLSTSDHGNKWLELDKINKNTTFISIDYKTKKVTVKTLKNIKNVGIKPCWSLYIDSNDYCFMANGIPARIEEHLG